VKKNNKNLVDSLVLGFILIVAGLGAYALLWIGYFCNY